jgi:hypothetical protein
MAGAGSVGITGAASGGGGSAYGCSGCGHSISWFILARFQMMTQIHHHSLFGISKRVFLIIKVETADACHCFCCSINGIIYFSVERRSALS